MRENWKFYVVNEARVTIDDKEKMCARSSMTKREDPFCIRSFPQHIFIVCVIVILVQKL